MQDFESKRKTLFECLEEEEKKLRGSILEQKENASCSENPPKKVKLSYKGEDSVAKLIGQESIFKKPELPIAKCLKPGRSPDYKINPHKWTKYSLDDADISDRMNTTAAFAFLKEMEIKKSADKDLADEKDNETNKLLFNKSVSLKRSIRAPDTDIDSEVDTAKLKGSKLIMPEYVIGKKSVKEKKIRTSTSKSSKSKQARKELKLAHLLEDEG